MDRLTIPEYIMLMDGVRLKETDADYRSHQLAYLNFIVKAEKRTGKNKSKPVFTNFKKFYNYEDAIKKAKVKKVTEKKSLFPGIGNVMRKGGYNA